MEKVTRGLDRLEREVQRGTLKAPKDGFRPTVAEIAVAATVAFAGINGLRWQEGRPGLEKWLGGWEKRESFKATRPDVDWKTGAPEEGEALIRGRVPCGERCMCVLIIQ